MELSREPERYLEAVLQRRSLAVERCDLEDGARPCGVLRVRCINTGGGVEISWSTVTLSGALQTIAGHVIASYSPR